MTQRKTSFQNPLTGVDCVVGYFFGKLYVKPSTSGVHWNYINEEERKVTKEWCEKHNGRKFATAEDAADYVAEHFGPDGQCAANVLRYGN